LSRHDGFACLNWQDSAPGVSEHQLSRLTERLYRVDESRARKSGGAGLGLAIARAIVEDHGGTLEGAHSDLGGLRWNLRIPLVVLEGG
jgi:two-component system sensor histidine kinase BaeS